MEQNLQDWSYLCLDLSVTGQLAHPRTVQPRTTIQEHVYALCYQRSQNG